MVALAALLLPFEMTLYTPLAGGDPSGFLGFLPEADPERSIIGKLLQAANTYTGLSINAFNLWRNPWSGLGDTLLWGDDTVAGLAVSGLVLTWQQVGTLLFAAVAIVAFVQVARRDDLRGVVIASLVLAIAFFALPTRVHERYLFPAIALSAPLLLSGRAWPWLAGGISLSFFANVYWVYTEDWSFAGGVLNPGLNGEPMRQAQFLTDTIYTDAGIWLVSAMILAVLAIVVWQSLRLALRPAGFDAAGLSAADRVHRRSTSRGPGPRRGGPAGHGGAVPGAERLVAHGQPRRPLSPTSALAGSTGGTRCCSSGWSPSPWSSASGGWMSLAASTSTRSTTPARRPSSSARGRTAGTGTCTSGRTRCWRSTSSPAGSSSPIPIGSSTPGPSRTPRARWRWLWSAGSVGSRALLPSPWMGAPRSWRGRRER